MKNKVLVTGAAGVTGNFAAKRLLKLDIPVRAMVRQHDERSAALAALGAEIVIGDFGDFDSLRAALHGVESTYFVYPVAPGLLEATALFAEAAKEAGVKLIVNVSQRTALKDAPSHSAQAHWVAERLLDRSGVPVTHLQPTLFMEWPAYFAQAIKENNLLISPFGAGSKYASINSEDIGRVGAAILANPEGHAGKTYPLYGPDELTQPEVASILSEVLGREINYLPVEPEAFSDIIRSSNSPYNTAFNIQHIAAIGDMFRSGEMAGHNNFVEEITGSKPLSFREFIAKNIELF
ncbi:NmrA family NAD(P)-binding protein [Mucilaginibacter celer]|uniref:NAD-dependent epimerase/dehydratase family protein n=1 Tax=Mucilaginibacter celer TaxID=2305508 RepID=A0A494VJ73_9SPHI|nr:NmrA family NAD(P)-binding protein [Mucilaginibacter celer]AYL94314.1 NAD-dependent epimerase/dehydratase family protein [Mucilaginibacter celer]